MEEAGAGWVNDQASASTPKRAGGAKSNPKTAGAEAKNGVVSDMDDGAEPVTPKPKVKAQAKSPTKAAGSATKRGRKAKDTDVGGNGPTTEDATPRKKPKVTSLNTGEVQGDLEVQVKKDTSGELEDGGEGAEVDGTDDEVETETEHD
jgi:hypothetical protein